MSSPRPSFLEPLLSWACPRRYAAQVPPARPKLRIRTPPLRTYTCHCGEEALEEAGCDCEQRDYYTPESANPWYCRNCDDFCSDGDGLCRACWRKGWR